MNAILPGIGFNRHTCAQMFKLQPQAGLGPGRSASAVLKVQKSDLRLAPDADSEARFRDGPGSARAVIVSLVSTLLPDEATHAVSDSRTHSTSTCSASAKSANAPLPAGSTGAHRVMIPRLQKPSAGRRAVHQPWRPGFFSLARGVLGTLL